MDRLISLAIVTVAGPTNWFINVGEGRSWAYLGMAEGDTSIDLSHQYAGIQIDGSGQGDYDRQWMAASASVSGDLARWNEPILDKLKAGINDSTLTPGQYPSGSIGTMLRTEGKSFKLCIVSTYAGKEVYSNAGAHPVWYFPHVYPLPMRRNLSTRATRERVAFECIMETDGTGAGTLYYNAITDALPPVS